MITTSDQNSAPNSGQSRSKVEAILPLSNLQKPFWVFRQLALSANEKTQSDHTQYPDGTIQVQFDITGVIDEVSLKESWHAVVDAFQSLRATVNENEQGKVFMVVREKVDTDVYFLDYTAMSEAQQSTELQSAISDDMTQGIDLEHIPTSRFTVYLLSKNKVHCVWTCHHLLADGWSSAVVTNAFIDTYSSKINGGTVQIDAGLDYVAYYREVSKSPVGKSVEFWTNELKGIATPSILADSSSKPVVNYSREFIRHGFEESVFSQLHSQARSHGITLATLLQAAWSLSVSIKLEQDDFLFGIVTNGRSIDSPGIDRTVGMLSNVLPVRCTISPHQPIAEWLQELQTHQFNMRSHESLSLGDILPLAEPGCRQQAFDSLMTIESLPTVHTQKEDNVSLSNYSSGAVSAFPLSISIVPVAPISIRAEYDPAKFSSNTVGHLLESYLYLLSTLANQWPASVGDLRQTIAKHSSTPTGEAARVGKRTPRESRLSKLIQAKNRTELSVLTIWEETLQKYPLSMDSDFFDAGGSSLGALQILDQLEQEFGTRIPIAHFIADPTPTAVCHLVMNNEEAQSIPTIVQLKAGTEDSALFCLHAGGGHALFYKSLSNRLRDIHSIYALQPKGIDGNEIPSDDVVDMVQSYLKEIRTVQPNGPYNFLCYCFGSALLLEMVRQLDAEGASIGHLFVVDAPSPVPKAHLMARMGWKSYLFYELLVQGKFKGLWQSLKFQIVRRRFRRQIKLPSNSEGLGHTAKVQLACERAFRSYRALPTHHHIHILHSSAGRSGFTSSVYMRHWKKLGPNQTKIYLSGEHQNILSEPEVINTANTIEDILGKPAV